ncbi:hypothetical protein D3230_06295 [Leucobacter chromiireducens subsp. solipictus]|uniref:site-specific DNA-methyltransferase (adenine-specific) n=1 Tax=Leucobacter chromiireducens subsp. solipictus TaxID=398235 RepID=A0ABS1SEL5_9MICO|nr:hypothetical protein [Leucobacter chromiireducens subsp. solipictus]
MHDEVRDQERRVRPDYGVSINRVMIGYIEVKAPGRSINPTEMTGHDLEQWTRQRDLPNLLYTNGTDWRYYRGGELIEQAILTPQSLVDVGANLEATPQLEAIFRAFLNWTAAPITSVRSLVRAIAPLTRLLRGEVLDQLAAERKRISSGELEDEQPFIGLARDWRRLLFPQAEDETFADGYAQAVTFALLLARTSNIEISGRSLHEVGRELGLQHSLMGRALQLLTDDVATDFKVSLDLLVTVVGAVRWDRIRSSKRDVYLYLYEEFLAEYDDELRQDSGTYYTPKELVDEMVRLTQTVLQEELKIDQGFASSDVYTIDPAMGTGTFLQSIVETVQEQVKIEEGPGGVADALTELAQRLVGFEIQMGPYAVAELRVAELLTQADASLPDDGLKLYVTDTLDDPNADMTQIASGLQPIANSRKRANAIKRSQKVNVVIGNPPYRELASGLGGWVEHGSGADGKESEGVLSAFLEDVPGRIAAKLKNFYIYFWRWGTWKVWESTPADETGIICFITTSGYVTGTAFKTMRRYIRQHASDGWIIDLTPEGQTPEVATRIFPQVRQPLAIGIFVRRPETDLATPANLRYLSVHGRRAEKFSQLRKLEISDASWRTVRTDWTAPFTAAASSSWDDWPTVDNIFPWYSPGVFPTRTWVYSPSSSTLEARWKTLVGEADQEERRKLMKDSGTAFHSEFKDLPGYPHPARLPKISSLTAQSDAEPIIKVGFRAFDRQYLLADPRLIHRAREGLWEAALVQGQVFVFEQHVHSISGGPGLLFSGWIPDNHHFNNRGGRSMPFLHPDGTANLASGLVTALTSEFGEPVEPVDVLAYVAAVTAHPGFTLDFADELETPGIRVPLTKDYALWAEAVELGKDLLTAQTFGRFDGSDIAYSQDDPRRVMIRDRVKELPQGLSYDASAEEIIVGGGRFGPVSRKVFEYSVGGRNVLKSWVGYRSNEPAGKRTSPLDDLNPTVWEREWTKDLLEVLTVLSKLVALEEGQAKLLKKIVSTPVFTVTELEECGTAWPKQDSDRKPRRAITNALFDVEAVVKDGN